MVEVPAKGRVLWLGADGAWDTANWERDTNYNGRYLQGATTAGTDGGDEHVHTAVHKHDGLPHSHQFGVPTAEDGRGSVKTAASTGGIFVARYHHGHQTVTSASATITYQDWSGDMSSVDGSPPYVEAVVLKPKAGAADRRVPASGVCYSDQTSAPVGWSTVAALDGKFAVGEPTGSGGGGGTGGAGTHGHTATHDHQDDEHEHAPTVCGAAITREVPASFLFEVGGDKHHKVPLLGVTLSNVSSTSPTVDVADSEPAHMELLAVENATGGPDVPDEIIVGFEGPASEIPNGEGWYLCDGTEGTPDLRAVQIKGTTNGASVLTTGGADKHVHNVQAHGHIHEGPHGTTAPVHSTLGSEYLTVFTISSFIWTVNDKRGHTHVWTISDTTPSMKDKGAFDSSLEDGRAEYREILWIKKVIGVPRPEMPVSFWLMGRRRRRCRRRAVMDCRSHNRGRRGSKRECDVGIAG